MYCGKGQSLADQYFGFAHGYFRLGETLVIDPDTPEDIRKKLEEAFPKYRKALEEKRAEGYWDIY